MSVVEVVSAEPVDGAPRQRRAWLWGLAVLVVVALTFLGARAWSWATHPESMSPYGSGVSGPAAVGASMAFGTYVSTDGPWTTESGGSPASVELESAVPRIVENTAAADVALLVCRSTGSDGVGAIAATELTTYCSSTTPVSPGRIVLSMPPYDQLIAVVTPHQKGVVHVAGVDVTYRDGLRRGTQQSGIDITVTAG